MSNLQVSNISWNVHLSYNDEWKTLDDVIKHVRGIFSRYEIKYCCYSKEMGKQNVTPHIQGFTQFSRRYSYKKIFEDWHVNNKVFVQKSLGTPSDNLQYVMKEGIEFFEFGTRPKVLEKKEDKGRVDYKRLIELATSGQLDKIIEEAPGQYLRQRLAFERLAHEGGRPDPCIRKNLWLVGSPGTGKSWFANRYDVYSSYNKPPSKWFCGYTNQKVIIVDDIDKSNAATLGYYLKIWGDRYSILSEVKGGSVYLRHETVIVTSNYRINTLYDDDDLRQAIHRRYKEIVVLDVRETPIGMIEIKTPGPNMNFVWLNLTNILD